MDVKSLYTAIPNAEGLRALRHYFDLRPVLEHSTSTLLRLAELVLAADQILSIRFKTSIFLNCSANSSNKLHIVVLLCLNVQTMKSQF